MAPPGRRDRESRHRIGSIIRIDTKRQPVTEWNQFKGDPARSGLRRDGVGPHRVTAAWTADLAGPAGDPICYHDTVYVGTERGNLYALEAESGRRRWVLDTASATAGAPAVDRDRLYFGTAAGTIAAVDRQTGDSEWTTELEGGVRGALALIDDTLVVGHDGGITILERDTGEVRGVAGTDNPVVGAPAVTDHPEWTGPRVFVGTADEEVTAFSLADLEEPLWTAPTDGQVVHGPTVDDDRVFVADDGGTLLALDADTGQTYFTYEATAGFGSGPTIVPDPEAVPGANNDLEGGADEPADDTTFLGGTDGYLHVTDTTFGRRKVRGWLFSKQGVALDGEARTSPVVVGDVVCVADTTGSVYGIDAERYDHWWHYHAGSPVTTTLAVGETRLFVGCEADELHCLEWDPETQPAE